MNFKDYKIAVIQSSLSRNAGGLFFSVKNLMLNILPWCDIKIFSLKDNFSDQDIDSWKPLNTCMLNNNGNSAFKYSFKLKKEILDFNPNLIHVHGLWEFPTLIANRLMRKNKIPYIISPRGMLDGWAINNSKYKKKIASTLYEKRNLIKSTCIHALCFSEYESIRAYGLKNPVAIIPNGIDFQPKTILINKEKKEKRKLLFLGRIHPKKGIELLIEAANELKEDDFMKNWEIIIAGWDENNHFKKLLKLTTNYNLNSSVKFIGPIFGEDKHKLLLSVDAFILPSYSEGLPMSILEAFSYGLPVLMTKECNLLEAFKIKAAIEIETNIKNIATNLSKLNSLSDYELIALSNNGYNFAKSNFSWVSISNKMLELYDWVLGKTELPSFIKLD